jgi:hypothetical protein
MVRCTPRIDWRLLRALGKLDDESLPIAETVRRVCELADELGVTRPSYAQIRRYLIVERELRAERIARRDRVIADVLLGRPPRDWDPYERWR